MKSNEASKTFKRIKTHEKVQYQTIDPQPSAERKDEAFDFSIVGAHYGKEAARSPSFRRNSRVGADPPANEDLQIEESHE